MSREGEEIINSTAKAAAAIEIAYLDFDETTLRRVERNDPDVQGLIIPEVVDRIEGSGRIIGESTSLRGIKVHVGSNYGPKKNWYHELLLGLSRNRNIESFELTFRFDLIPTVDIFQTLGFLFENNRNNFHSLQVRYDSNQIKCLASMLSKCNECKLQLIGPLYRSPLYEYDEDDTTSILNTLTSMDNLVEIYLSCSIVEETGCIALARLLNNSASAIHELVLRYSYLNDEGITILSNALAMTINLTSLELTEILDVSEIGWHSLSVGIAHPMCKLEKLCLINTSINDEGISDLGESLAVNSTVKFLNLSCNEYITAIGWQWFSEYFSNRCSALEEIDFALCGVDDEGASAIAMALEGKSSLKRLGMGFNHTITADGWAHVFHTLLFSVPSLEELQVFEADDDNPSDWTDHMDWTVLSRALCDSTSIEMTYSSNHTFHSLEENENKQSLVGLVPDDILLLLQMNRSETNKAEVARKKILKYHFAEGGTNKYNFSRMPLTSMPVAIEWIGRHRSELSLMYNVIRELPMLFDVQNEPVVKKQRC